MNGTKTTKSRYVRRKLLACRLRLGLTQKQVADAIGITEGYYNCIENGLRMPSIYTWRLLGGVLRADWKELIDLQEVE